MLASLDWLPAAATGTLANLVDYVHGRTDEPRKP
jgi:hypothetical protein